MTQFDFEIHAVQVPREFAHAYEIEDLKTGTRFPAPRDGNNEYVDRFPDIADYLLATYQVDVRPLVVNLSIDRRVPDDDGFVWHLPRAGYLITIRDRGRIAGKVMVEKG